MDLSELMIHFRRLLPFQQALIAGGIIFAIYWLYNYLSLGMGPIAAASESIYSAIIFTAVYYFTTIIIMRKSIQAGAQAKGPRKGLRNK